ncbi:MAG: hypothetical protein GY798_25465, partial [Hyphomicrobiales bacterium]|nr:hypothetical protein [Hyphomicrobiales bacterium]
MRSCGELQFDGRIHLRNRDYGPTTGTFLTKDPLVVDAEPPGHPTSGNVYSYVGNDPLNYQDPLGLSRVGDGAMNAGDAGAACDLRGGRLV